MSHHSLFVLRLHLAVEDTDRIIPERTQHKLCGIIVGGFQIDLAFVDQRTDDVALSALVHLLFDEAQGSVAFVAADKVCFDLGTAGRQLVDDRDIKISVDY